MLRQICLTVIGSCKAGNTGEGRGNAAARWRVPHMRRWALALATSAPPQRLSSTKAQAPARSAAIVAALCHCDSISMSCRHQRDDTTLSDLPTCHLFNCAPVGSAARAARQGLPSAHGQTDKHTELLIRDTDTRQKHRHRRRQMDRDKDTNTNGERQRDRLPFAHAHLCRHNRSQIHSDRQRDNETRKQS